MLAPADRHVFSANQQIQIAGKSGNNRHDTEVAGWAV
jgi:hypothetical protein